VHVESIRLFGRDMGLPPVEEPPPPYHHTDNSPYPIYSVEASSTKRVVPMMGRQSPKFVQRTLQRRQSSTTAQRGGAEGLSDGEEGDAGDEGGDDDTLKDYFIGEEGESNATEEDEDGEEVDTAVDGGGGSGIAVPMDQFSQSLPAGGLSRLRQHRPTTATPAGQQRRRTLSMMEHQREEEKRAASGKAGVPHPHSTTTTQTASAKSRDSGYLGESQISHRSGRSGGASATGDHRGQ